MAVGMPLVQTALMGVGLLESNRAQRENKAAKKQMKADQEKQFKQKAQEQMAAKKQQYSTSRAISRRGAQRGRMSTILNKSDTLG